MIHLAVVYWVLGAFIMMMEMDKETVGCLRLWAGMQFRCSDKTFFWALFVSICIMAWGWLPMVVAAVLKTLGEM